MLQGKRKGAVVYGVAVLDHRCVSFMKLEGEKVSLPVGMGMV